jgi:predicted ester cyclase
VVESEEKISIVKNFIAALETGELDKAEEYLSDDFKFNAGGKAEFFEIQRRLRTAFPDRLLNPNVVGVEGNQVKVVLKMTGTHNGDLALPIPGLENIPPTGRSVALPEEPTEYIVENNKIVEWVSRPGGFPEIFRQLGLEVPPHLR